MTTENIRQQNFFLWLRRDVDELKVISDDKNYYEMNAASSLTRRELNVIRRLLYIQNTSYRLS